MTEIDAALVERMCKLVRVIDTQAPRYLESPWLDEAIAIAALLPEPVDPDLVEAREICARVYTAWGKNRAASIYRDGGYDETHAVQHALAAIRRGLQA